LIENLKNFLSPARTYTTSYLGGPVATTSYIGGPVATTTYGGVYSGIYGDAVTTTVDPVFGSTVTRTFSPSRTYTTVHEDAPITTTTVDPVFGSTVTRTFSPSRSYTTVVNDAPLATVVDPVYGAYDGLYGTHTSVIASPGRTTTTYGPYGTTTRTVNYF
jgi:hypothetical protein